MSDLTEFLLARLAEDEADAKLAASVTDGIEDDWQDVTQPITLADTIARPQEPWAKRYGYAYQHICRHHPARVLAEVEAKRRIVELHSGTEYGRPGKHLCQDSMTTADECETLRALVTVYSDHPDYDPSWRV